MNSIFPDYYRGPAGKTPTNPFNRIDKLDKQQASYLKFASQSSCVKPI